MPATCIPLIFTPPRRKNPSSVLATPFRTPTTVVVSAELASVHRKSEKLSSAPAKSADANVARNPPSLSATPLVTRATPALSSPVATVASRSRGADKRALYVMSSALPTPRSAPVRSTAMRYAAWRRQLANPLTYPPRSNSRSPAPATTHPRTITATERAFALDGSGASRHALLHAITTAGVRRFTALYVGMLTRPRLASANATFALYRIATGASRRACAGLIAGKETTPRTSRSRDMSTTVATICASKMKFDSRKPYTFMTALFTKPIATATVPYSNAAAAPASAGAGETGPIGPARTESEGSAGGL